MRTLLEKTKNRLMEAGIPDAYNIANELVCHVFKVESVEIMTRNYLPDRAKEAELFEYTELCAAGKPLQYVIKTAHFLDIELYVDHRVLIPRPETEGLADIARQFIDLRKKAQQETTVLDLCTGSGCIALHLAKHGAKVTATDISSDALDVAKWNASALGQEVEFLQGDLFEALCHCEGEAVIASEAKQSTRIDRHCEGETDRHCEGEARSNLPKFDIITANPPYIPSSVIPTLDVNVRAWEPLTALDGGEHGWELPDRIALEYDKFLNPGGLFLMEIGDDQGQHYKNLCPNGRIIQDLEGHDRILAIRKI